MILFYLTGKGAVIDAQYLLRSIWLCRSTRWSYCLYVIYNRHIFCQKALYWVFFKSLHCQNKLVSMGLGAHNVINRIRCSQFFQSRVDARICSALKCHCKILDRIRNILFQKFDMFGQFERPYRSEVLYSLCECVSVSQPSTTQAHSGSGGHPFN